MGAGQAEDAFQRGNAGPDRPAGFPSSLLAAWGQIRDPSDALLKRIRNWAMLFFLAAALVMAMVTGRLVSAYIEDETITFQLVAVLLTDFALFFIFVVFAAYQVLRKSLKSRSVNNVTAPLYLRLMRLFALAALIPAVGMAAVGTLVIGVVLGDLIVEEVSETTDNTLDAAKSYENEQYLRQHKAISEIGFALSHRFDEISQLGTGVIRQTLQSIQRQSDADLNHLFIVDGNGTLIARGNDSYAFDCDAPAAEIIRMFGGGAAVQRQTGARTISCASTREMGSVIYPRCYDSADGGQIACPDSAVVDAAGGGNAVPGLVVVYRISGSDKLYSMYRIVGESDRYLYGSSETNSRILQLANSTDNIVNRLAAAVLQWSLLYVVVLLVLLIVLLNLAIRIALRLSRPIEELADLADKVREDDEKVTIPEYTGNDEIAKLGRSFKEMVSRLVAKSQDLEAQYTVADAEKRRFDRVLGTISTGVIGLDSNFNIRFVNESARQMLDRKIDAQNGRQNLSGAVPEFLQLVKNFKDGNIPGAQDKILIARQNDTVLLHARIASGQNEIEDEGIVISFDDITELTKREIAEAESATVQQMAKQIAHDVRSPLQTSYNELDNMEYLLSRHFPGAFDRIGRQFSSIHSSLQRISRHIKKFQSAGALGQLTLKQHRIVEVLRQFTADVDRQHANIDISFSCGASEELYVTIDRTEMLGVFENIISNAVDSIRDQEVKEKSRENSGNADYRGRIEIQVRQVSNNVEIAFRDNGTGLLPKAAGSGERRNSTRGKDRGYGLTIVNTVVKKHSGQFSLSNPPAIDGESHGGARAVVRLPLHRANGKDRN